MGEYLFDDALVMLGRLRACITRLAVGPDDPRRSRSVPNLSWSEKVDAHRSRRFRRARCVDADPRDTRRPVDQWSANCDQLRRGTRGPNYHHSAASPPIGEVSWDVQVVEPRSGRNLPRILLGWFVLVGTSVPKGVAYEWPYVRPEHQGNQNDYDRSSHVFSFLLELYGWVL